MLPITVMSEYNMMMSLEGAPHFNGMQPLQLSEMPVKAIKHFLSLRKVSIHGVTDKSELVSLLKK
jgi:hypothetical protein